MTYWQILFNLLKQRNEKIVFAESCTAGRVSSLMATLPGVSECLCGSFVTYRASQKVAVLRVPQDVIDEFTTESEQTAIAMTHGALSLSPEADWAASIVGHLGPGAPPEKDGKIYMHVAKQLVELRDESVRGRNWNTLANTQHTFTGTLENTGRRGRLEEASLWLLRVSGEFIGAQI